MTNILSAAAFSAWMATQAEKAAAPAAPAAAPAAAVEPNGLPERFQDYTADNFTVDGFEALSPWQQAQIRTNISGFVGRFKNPYYTDPIHDSNDGMGNWTSGEKWELRAPQGDDEWSSFLAEYYPERSEFFAGSNYGVEDEMRYVHSLFDEQNMQVPDEPAAAEEAAPDPNVADAPDTTEEEVKEVEEEQDMLRILSNSPTTVPKDNVNVKTNQPTADKGGTQGYKKDRNNTLAKIVQPKNLNMSI